MNKNLFRAVTIWFILLIAYNVIIFVIPFTHSKGFWFAYAITMSALILQIVVLGFTFYKKEGVKNRFYGWPIEFLCSIYAVIHIAIGLFFMIVEIVIPLWIQIIVQVIVFSVAVVNYISIISTRNEILHQKNQTQLNTYTMKSLGSKANALAIQYSNVEIGQVADAFRYSDPVSNASTVELEQDLLELLEKISSAMGNGNEMEAIELCQKTKQMLAIRNQLCKENK